MASTMRNINTAIFHMIDQSVFVVYPATELALKVSSERFRLSDPLHAPVALNILYELIDTLDFFYPEIGRAHV